MCWKKRDSFSRRLAVCIWVSETSPTSHFCPNSLAIIDYLTQTFFSLPPLGYLTEPLCARPLYSSTPSYFLPTSSNVSTNFILTYGRVLDSLFRPLSSRLTFLISHRKNPKYRLRRPQFSAHKVHHHRIRICLITIINNGLPVRNLHGNSRLLQLDRVCWLWEGQIDE